MERADRHVYSGALPIQDLGWDVPLDERVGAPTRLAGIKVFHEFPWMDVFTSERTEFRNGQCLAEFVRDAAQAAGKTPALLLTTRSKIEDGLQETDDLFIYVLNVKRYR